MVAAGTQITFDVVGTTDLYLATSPEEVRGQVLAALQPFFDVFTVTLTVPSVIENVLSFNWVNTAYTAVVTLDTRVAYADVDDIGSIVANAFYQAVDALPTVTARGYGEPSPGTAIAVTGTSLGDVFAGLQTTTVILVVAIVGLVYILANGKNVGALAKLAP